MKDKNKNHEEELKDEFSLTQYEVHDYGQLVLERIFKRYEALISDPDHCWSLDTDIELFKKICTIVIRTQCGRILREYEKEKNNKSTVKEKRKTASKKKK
jgi:hypothetical protein